MTPRSGGILLSVTGMLLFSGCGTVPPRAPVDLAQPGWHVEHGQAVWCRSVRDAGVAGELTVARHADGSAVIEFIKPPFSLVIVRLEAEFWELRLPGKARAYRGQGRPPARSAWLVLAQVLAQEPLPERWRWHVLGEQSWRLENSATGERIEVYFPP